MTKNAELAQVYEMLDTQMKEILYETYAAIPQCRSRFCSEGVIWCLTGAALRESPAVAMYSDLIDVVTAFLFGENKMTAERLQFTCRFVLPNTDGTDEPRWEKYFRAFSLGTNGTNEIGLFWKELLRRKDETLVRKADLWVKALACDFLDPLFAELLRDNKDHESLMTAPMCLPPEQRLEAKERLEKLLHHHLSQINSKSMFLHKAYQTLYIANSPDCYLDVLDREES